MKKTTLITAAFLLLGASAEVSAQALRFPGGRGMSHLHSAWGLDKGSLTVNLYTTSYFNTVLDTRPSRAGQTITFWDVQGVVGISYATGRHLELRATNVTYQDTHQGSSGFNLPSNLSLSAKFGSIGSVQSPLKFALLVEGLLPVAQNRNILFEPYSAGKFEAGVTGIVSYASDLLIPEAGFNLHANVGFWHHNDTGSLLTDNVADIIAVPSPSRAFIWGAGFTVPAAQLDFGLELTGRTFSTRPPVTARSREDYVYLTPSVTYRASNRTAFTAGIDVRVSKDIDNSVYRSGGTTLRETHPGLPSYPGWRMQLGGTFHLTKPAPREVEKPLFVQPVEGEGDQELLIASKAPLQDQLVRERRKTELAEEELEKIRADRRKMEDMLARLRQILRYGKETPVEVTDQPAEKDEKKEKAVSKKN